jgi:hypothetical protein
VTAVESAAPPASSGAERIVAVALGAMIAVLLWVWIDLRRPTAFETASIDLTNPLLSAEAGECVEVEDLAGPGFVQRLHVIAPTGGEARGRSAAVLRPHDGPESIPGYLQAGDPDLRTTAPYLAAEVRSATAAPPGAPAGRRDVLLFDLNAFGMPRGSQASVILRDIRPALVRWHGRPLRCHQVTISRHDQLEGIWVLYVTREAPALGTVLRKYLSDQRGLVQHTFHPCR